MGISYDKMGYFSKEYSDINKKEESKNPEIENQNQIENKKRSISFNSKKNNNIPINYNSENKKIKEKKEVLENINNNENLDQKNKIFKCLSYEKLQKIDILKKSINNNSSYSNQEINNKCMSECEKQEIYKNFDDSNSEEECSDLYSNSNSTSNKELQIIDENMKSLFLNSTKSIKEKENVSTSFSSEDKNSSCISSQESSIDYELNFYKSGNEIRNSYIQKLVSKALFLPNNKPKTHNSLIIFDWDDTLLPTSFLTQGPICNENMILNENEKKKIEKLEKSALKLLNMAISKGDVYIITNAGLGWVEYSSQKFYPKVFEILPKIKIISARGQWEKEYPGDSRKWKIQTFLSLQKEMNTKLVTNIICLGDSLFEMEAGRILANCFSEAFVKTIKFKEGPKPDELYKQLLLVTNQFISICSAVKNLTIRVEKKKKDQ